MKIPPPFTYQFIYIQFLLCINLIYAVNFEKAGIAKLIIVNNTCDIYNIEVSFSLFDSATSRTFIEKESFSLNAQDEYFFDVAHFQESFDNRMHYQKNDDIEAEELKKIFDCIKHLSAINKKTGEQAKLYIYGSESSCLKVFILAESEAKNDCFHITFDEAINYKSIYYNDCINNIDKIYPNGLTTQSYKLALDSNVTPADFLHRIKDMYEQFFPNVPQFNNLSIKNAEPRIRKHLFQIWIGSDALSESYKNNQYKWKQVLSSDWSYKLYADVDINELEFSSPESKAIYYSLPNGAAKSDLLRMEILNKYGGVYVDIDTEPFEPLNYLVTTFDFFGLLYGPRCGDLFVDTYFIGAIPHHPIIQQTLKNIVSLANTKSNLHPNLYTSIIPLTRAVCEHLGHCQTRDIILPVKYFDNYSTSIFSYGTHYPKRLWKK